MADVSRTVTLSIQELRLEGIAPFERFALADAMQQELGRLFTERGVPAGLSNAAPPMLGPVDSTGLNAAALGRSIAAALYEGWA